MDKPQPNKGGRPRVAEPRTTVCTWLPASYHDRLVKIANARNETVSALVKTIILRQLDRAP